MDGAGRRIDRRPELEGVPPVAGAVDRVARRGDGAHGADEHRGQDDGTHGAVHAASDGLARWRAALAQRIDREERDRGEHRDEQRNPQHRRRKAREIADRGAGRTAIGRHVDDVRRRQREPDRHRDERCEHPHPAGQRDEQDDEADARRDDGAAALAEDRDVEQDHGGAGEEAAHDRRKRRARGQHERRPRRHEPEAGLGVGVADRRGETRPQHRAPRSDRVGQLHEHPDREDEDAGGPDHHHDEGARAVQPAERGNREHHESTAACGWRRPTRRPARRPRRCSRTTTP